MPQLILIRHGQSQWNLENRFTGWWDVDVTEKGAAEAWAAGELMKTKGIAPDVGFTSVQTRAIKTLNLALEAMGRLWLPVTKDWRLNERHYGGLTGLDKAETADEILNYPWPDLTEPYRYTGLDERVAGLQARGYAVCGGLAETVFEIMGRPGELSEQQSALRDRYAEGLAAYRACRWDDARRAFLAALEAMPGDGPSRAMMGRVDRFQANPPPVDWDGAWRLDQK